MPGLVTELQKDALNSAVPLNELLRKALVVATKLRIDEFKTWIRQELKGYSSGEDIPQYREIQGTIKAWNPYNGWIPVIIQDEKMAMHLRQRRISQSISELESLVKNRKKDSPLIIHYSPEIENMLMEHGPCQPSLHIGSSAVYGIIDGIRNTVLEWSLKLEEEGILGDGMSFSKEEKEKAKESPNIHIQNFQGVLGDVSDSSLTQNLEMTIKTEDFSTLADYLKNKGVQDDDISVLEKAIKDDPKPKDKTNLGTNVSAWIGQMIAKAASGVWQIGAGAAGNLLATAICTYYGI